MTHLYIAGQALSGVKHPCKAMRVLVAPRRAKRDSAVALSVFAANPLDAS